MLITMQCITVTNCNYTWDQACLY